MVAICDLNEYRSCTKPLGPLVAELFETLHALCNLLLVKPENLQQVCSEDSLVRKKYFFGYVIKIIFLGKSGQIDPSQFYPIKERLQSAEANYIKSMNSIVILALKVTVLYNICCICVYFNFPSCTF